MTSSRPHELAITGIGVTSAIGQGKASFGSALFSGRTNFRVMARPYRQKGSHFLGAEIDTLACPDRVRPNVFSAVSLSAQAALAAVAEAWGDAKLDDVDPARIGLVIGGSNVQQRDLVATVEKYAERMAFVRPSYALSFMDTDICGLCTEEFGIKGLALTVGGASASGHVAVSQAMQAVLSGQVDVCIAVGALMDLSYLECQAFRSLGAMGSDRFAQNPELACRPYDKSRDGFIFGECCGVTVVERAEGWSRSGVTPYARVSPCAVAMDANRRPNPSLEGEVRAIEAALQYARVSPKDIDYVNPHGSGSTAGDEVELQAIRTSGLSHAYLNATKSLTGHGLSAAGIVEVIATLLQMQSARLHGSANLDEPIDPSLNWVPAAGREQAIKCALNISIGFGGLNTALCIQQY